MSEWKRATTTADKRGKKPVIYDRGKIDLMHSFDKVARQMIGNLNEKFDKGQRQMTWGGGGCWERPLLSPAQGGSPPVVLGSDGRKTRIGGGGGWIYIIRKKIVKKD